MGEGLQAHNRIKGLNQPCRERIQLLLPNELIARILKSFDYEAILFGPTPTDIVPDLQADLWYSSGASHFWYPNQSKPGTAWET